jgi:hypothetical protein
LYRLDLPGGLDSVDDGVDLGGRNLDRHRESSATRSLAPLRLRVPTTPSRDGE